MKKPYFITTAIAYASQIPHIGNVYEIILTDAIARFKRLEGYDVFFQTGTDEHGQKIASNATRNNLKPDAYVDVISGEIKKLYDKLNISYDIFVRTTDSYHKKAVGEIYKKLLDKGDIYKDHYEGWYSVSEEAFVNESDIVDGRTPAGDIPVWTSEEGYFFRLSKYQKKLIDYINKNKEFIYPESRRNEMVNNFLKEPIPDICVSRTSFDWGVKLPFDKKHVAYVWIDALANYITFLGYNPLGKSKAKFNKYWPADLHIIGKDILRFHTIFWPILLLALDLPLPKKVFGHPWILIDKAKMSKSKGNVIYTGDLLKSFPVDSIRYYCLHEIPFAQDGNLTYELLIERHNTDLVNTIGNLVNRTLAMINKYRDGNVKKTIIDCPLSNDLREKAINLYPKMRELIDKCRVSDSLDELVILTRSANKYIEESKPWQLAKDKTKSKELDNVLYTLIETIRIISVLLQPYLPDTAKEISKQINFTKNMNFTSLKKFGLYPTQKIGSAKAIFERYKLDEKMEEILKRESVKTNN